MEYAHKLFSTRGGTLALAGLTALIAAIAVFAYVKHYRNSVQEGGVPATVLVSSGPIVKGTLGATWRPSISTRPRRSGRASFAKGRSAIRQPGGTVAKTDIFPGQQLTVTDFVRPMAGCPRSWPASSGRSRSRSTPPTG